MSFKTRKTIYFLYTFLKSQMNITIKSQLVHFSIPPIFLNNQTQQSRACTIGSNASKALGAEALTGGQHEDLKVLERLVDELQDLILNDHMLKSNPLEPLVRGRHGLVHGVM